MKRATIIVDGVVQGVGFRYTVRRIAKSLGLAGQVKNMDDGSVEIVAEGSEQDIESLIQHMRGVKKPAIVEDIRVSYQSATKKGKSFSIIPGDMLAEMVEGFGTGAIHFEQANEKLDKMLDKQDKMLDKQDKMLDKQDETIATIRERSDRMLDKQDKMLDKQDETIATIRERSDRMLDKQDETTTEIRNLSDNMQSMMDRRFQRLESEIRLIKNKIGI